MKDIILTSTRLFDLFDSISIGAMLLSVNLEIIGLNRSAELMTGVSFEMVRGKNCREILQKEWCGGECPFTATLSTSLRSTQLKILSTPNDGDTNHITRMLLPLFTNKDNTATGWLEIFQDNSAFKELIKRIRYEDRRLKMILDNLDLGVLTVDRGGHVTFFNTKAETMTAYTRKDILGKSLSLLFHDDEGGNLSRLSATINDGEPRSSGETGLRTKTGETLPVRAEFMALKNNVGHIVGGLATLADLSLMHQLNSVIRNRYTFFDMVGRSPAMQRLFEIIPIVAESDATVLIEGATGTGKDLLARVLHHASPRSASPLIKVNCAALPDNLLESEMFGYVKGAFTGADRDKPGRFQDADKGSIFLDEIGDMPLPLQAKLLRVLEDKEFYPLGSRKTVKVDVRIISATNRGLETLVKEKRFREDLYYRLNVMRLEMPPLRERQDDLPLLISHFLRRLSAARYQKPPEISEEAMAVLLDHPYPGNIRELENILEHALILCRGQRIRREHLPLILRQMDISINASPDISSSIPCPITMDSGKDSGEKNALLTALRKYRWNRGQTAKALNIDRTTLWRKIRKYDLAP